MEAEVVAMCLRMYASGHCIIAIPSSSTVRYNHPTGAGTTTSGGTESICMSVKTHRDWARDTKGITRPEMFLLLRLPIEHGTDANEVFYR